MERKDFVCPEEQVSVYYILLHNFPCSGKHLRVKKPSFNKVPHSQINRCVCGKTELLCFNSLLGQHFQADILVPGQGMQTGDSANRNGGFYSHKLRKVTFYEPEEENMDLKKTPALPRSWLMEILGIVSL